MKKTLIFILLLSLFGAIIFSSCKKVRIDSSSPPPPPPPPPLQPSIFCGDSVRPKINAQLIPIGTLTQSRNGMAVASAGNKILFAGGMGYGASSRVDIYDITTNSWSKAELCTGRHSIAAVAAGNKIFFAGGEVGDGTLPVDSIDIYDASTNSWTVAHLSKAGHSIAAASANNKVLFAGGEGGFTGEGRETRVDIYDLETGTWSTSSLSEVKRGEHVAVACRNKIYIAGGEAWPAWPEGPWGTSEKVDIYDASTNSWSASYLRERKMNLAGIALNDKIYWAGGQTGSFPSLSNSCSVEIVDVNTWSSSVQYLSKPALWWNSSGQNAVIRNNKIIFCRFVGEERDKFDLYDIISNTWSIGILSQPIPEEASIISVNNTIYIAGGNQVWKLEF